LQIRAATERDFPAISRLNAEAQEYLNSQVSLTAEDLSVLLRLAAYFRVATIDSTTAAFLIAVPSGTTHDDPNYRWFSARVPNFIYIDRIIVAPAFRGRKIGSALYADLFEVARESGVPLITCEIDCDPPNTVSSLFHARFGFTEVGRHAVDDGKKTVSLMSALV
jgi:uncharacterized protein